MQRNLFFHEFRQEASSSDEYTETFFKTWKGGGVFGLLNIQSSDIDLERVGALLCQSAVDLIMNSVEENRIRLVETILRELNKTFENTVKSEGGSSDNSHIKIGMLLFLGDVVYVGMLGKICVFLDRSGKILDFSKINQNESDLKVVSGRVYSNDLYFISNKSIAGIDNGLQKNLSSFVNQDSLLVTPNEILLNNTLDEVEAFLSEPKAAEVDDELEGDELDKDLKVTDLTDHDDSIADNVVDDEILLEGDNNVESTSVVDEVFFEQEQNQEQEIEDIENDNTSVADVDSAQAALSSTIEKESSVQSKLNSLKFFFTEKVLPGVKVFSIKLFKVLGKIWSWIIETIVGYGGRTKFKTESSNSLKKRRIILLVLIVLFGACLFFSTRWINTKNEEKKILESYNTEFSRIEQLLNDADSKITYDETEAKSLVEQAKTAATALGGVKVDNNKAGDLLKRCSELSDRLEKIVRLTNPEIVTDLKIWFENAEPSDVLWFDNVVWVADPISASVYTVSTDGTTPKKVLDRASGLKSPKFLEKVNNKLFLWDNDLGLFQISKDDDSYKISSVIGLTKTTLGNVTEFSSYESDGSLYFLIADEGKIKKSSPVGTGYAYPQVRLEDESFKNAKDLEINGLIYTLGSGELIRYYGNDRDNAMELETVSPAISSETNNFDLFVSLKIVLLDKTNKRVIVYDQPDGSSSLFKLDKQYMMSDGETRFFNDLREVTIDVSTNTVYILDGGRIIKFGVNE